MLVFSIAKLNYWERIGHHWQRISFILSLFFPPHSRVLLELTLPKKPLILFSQMTILAALSRLLCGVAMFTTVSRNFFNSNWRSTLWLLLLPLLAHVQYKTRHWRYVMITTYYFTRSNMFFFFLFFFSWLLWGFHLLMISWFSLPWNILKCQPHVSLTDHIAQ